MIAPLDAQGDYVDGFGWLAGSQRGDGRRRRDGARCASAGRIVQDELYAHSVPVCWRCKSHVLFRLVVRVVHQRRRRARRRCSPRRETVDWEPPHIGSSHGRLAAQHGRLVHLAQALLGPPAPLLPVRRRATSSRSSGPAPSCASARSDPALVDALPELHRPWIDDIKITLRIVRHGRQHACPRSATAGSTRASRRSRPWATSTIPKAGRQRFPAEWIREMREQVRLWYYSMLFMSVVLEGRAPYERALSYERVISETGEKFSKTGHMIRFDDAVAGDRRRPDPLPVLPAAARCRVPLRLRGGRAGAASHRRALEHRVVLRHVRGHRSRRDGRAVARSATALHVTDRWLLARTAQLVDVATAAMRREDTATTVREAEQFIEEVSNWYVARQPPALLARHGNPEDKVACHSTLFEALRAVTLVLAPIVPFITEELWQQAIRPVRRRRGRVGAPRALARGAGDVARLRSCSSRRGPCARVISTALRLREESKLRVRQPLPAVTIVADDEARAALLAAAGHDPRRAQRQAGRVRRRPLRRSKRTTSPSTSAGRARAPQRTGRDEEQIDELERRGTRRGDRRDP